MPLLRRRGELAALVAAVALLVSSCGEDTEGDDLPNWLTGLSGVLIVVVVIWLLARFARNRR